MRGKSYQFVMFSSLVFRFSFFDVTLEMDIGAHPRYPYSSSRAVLSEGGEALCMRTKSARKEAILSVAILL